MFKQLETKKNQRQAFIILRFLGNKKTLQKIVRTTITVSVSQSMASCYLQAIMILRPITQKWNLSCPLDILNLMALGLGRLKSAEINLANSKLRLSVVAHNIFSSLILIHLITFHYKILSIQYLTRSKKMHLPSLLIHLKSGTIRVIVLVSLAQHQAMFFLHLRTLNTLERELQLKKLISK